jgi:hypothetical protein
MIKLAIDDLRDLRKSVKHVRNRHSAYYFFMGKSGSPLSFWCSVLGVNRRVYQVGLAKDLTRYEKDERRRMKRENR